MSSCKHSDEVSSAYRAIGSPMHACIVVAGQPLPPCPPAAVKQQEQEQASPPSPLLGAHGGPGHGPSAASYPGQALPAAPAAAMPAAAAAIIQTLLEESEEEDEGGWEPEDEAASDTAFLQYAEDLFDW